MRKNFLKFNDDANIFEILISEDFAYGKNIKKLERGMAVQK